MNKQHCICVQIVDSCKNEGKETEEKWKKKKNKDTTTYG